MTKLRVVLSVAIAAALLTGCAERSAPSAEVTDAPSAFATSVPSATASPTPATSNAPTQTPTPTSTPAAKWPPAIGDLKLSSEGVGYIRMGKPVPSKPKGQALVTWTNDFCSFGAGNPSTGWDTVYGKFTSGNFPFMVITASKTSTVEDIYILSKDIHTAHGLHIGSSLADVKALGGKLTKGKTPEDIDAWVIHGSAGELVFWVGNTTNSDSPKDVVSWIQLQREATEPHFEFELGCE